MKMAVAGSSSGPLLSHYPWRPTSISSTEPRSCSVHGSARETRQTSQPLDTPKLSEQQQQLLQQMREKMRNSSVGKYHPRFECDMDEYEYLIDFGMGAQVLGPSTKTVEDFSQTL